MMPPGHVAITWGVANVIQKNNPRLANLDYRLLGLCALAPDLIDKPLAILVFTEAHTSQLIAHSLLLSVALLVTALIWWHRAIPYVVAFSAHLLGDRMWNHTESFWWPLYGWNVFWQFKPMNTPETMMAVYWDIVTRYPQVWVVEIFAVIYLLRFVYINRLYIWPNAWTFLFKGLVSIEHKTKNFGETEKTRSLNSSVETVMWQPPRSE